MKLIKTALAATVALCLSQVVQATELEVTHWWTSGSEAAAVSELAKAFDASGDKWKDGAIAGSAGVARPIIISRIMGGDPMGATQLNHGKQAEELITNGLLLDLTEVAEKEKWRDIIKPVSLLDACTVNGKVYCAPLNIHSWQWMWLSHKAFADAKIDVPKNWDEFVAAAPKLEAAGKIPLAMGQQPWQPAGAFGVLASAVAGLDTWKAVYVEKKMDVAAGPEFAKVFAAADQARKLSAKSKVQDWNQATNMVIAGEAGGQIMGDWAQGEFQIAKQVAGKDYTCLPGLGVNEVISTAGDAFYFPVLKDADKTAAQKRLASLVVSKDVQVAFNLKKGSLPIRGDIDMNVANDCMKKGLKILADGKILPSPEQTLSPDTISQIDDLMVEFWNDEKITPADVQARFAKIIGADE